MLYVVHAAAGKPMCRARPRVVLLCGGAGASYDSMCLESVVITGVMCPHSHVHSHIHIHNAHVLAGLAALAGGGRATGWLAACWLNVGCAEQCSLSPVREGVACMAV
jgi:hypothetical protein